MQAISLDRVRAEWIAGLLLSSLCLWSVDGRAQEAELAFKAHCARCHGARDIASWGRQYPDVGTRNNWLSRFLQRHYPPPEAERGLILGHIDATIAAQSRSK